MKERPILFSGPMVRAILEGRKTQTRRAVRPQPPRYPYGRTPTYLFENLWGWCAVHGTVRAVRSEDTIRCPYGVPGDRLWVRETHANLGKAPLPGGGTSEDIVLYRADHGDDCKIDGVRWTPAIHMYRRHSRITLEVVSIRAERLQAISDEDARSEGVSDFATYGTAKVEFASLWESINGAGSWDENPWVWAVEFRVLEKGGAH